MNICMCMSMKVADESSTTPHSKYVLPLLIINCIAALALCIFGLRGIASVEDHTLEMKEMIQKHTEPPPIVQRAGSVDMAIEVLDADRLCTEETVVFASLGGVTLNRTEHVTSLQCSANQTLERGVIVYEGVEYTVTCGTICTMKRTSSGSLASAMEKKCADDVQMPMFYISKLDCENSGKLCALDESETAHCKTVSDTTLSENCYQSIRGGSLVTICHKKAIQQLPP